MITTMCTTYHLNFQTVYIIIYCRVISMLSFFTIYCNCSVPSQLRCKIHPKLSSTMGFCSLNHILTVSAVNASTCTEQLLIFTILLPKRYGTEQKKFMLKFRQRNGMNGYNFSKTKQLLYKAILLVKPKMDMTLNIGNNAASDLAVR